MKNRVLALSMALLLGAAPAVVMAARAEAPRAPAAIYHQIQPQDPATLIVGEDACAVLTDDDILRATDGDSVVSRTPGPQAFLPAGCAWEVALEGALGPITVYLGVASQGGRQQYDTMVPFDDVGEPVSGVGDEATDLGFGSFMAVEGDTAVSIQAIAFGGGRPDSLVSRALGWVALTRLASRPPLLATAALAGPGVLPTDQPSLDAVAAIRTEAFGDESVAATIDLLASAGIEVVDPLTADAVANVAGAASPLKVMDFQARSLALDAWGGSGLSGAALDGVVGMPDDVPLTSSMLAGWLAAVDTPNARLGRALMAGQDVSDPTSLTFPMLVLLLFSADIVADTQAAAQAPAATPLAAGGSAFLAGAMDGSTAGTLRTAQASPCSAGQTFVDDVISTVFGVLGQPVPGDVPGEVVGDIWDWLAAQGESFQRAAGAELTPRVISSIRDTAGLIAVIGQVGAVAMPMIVTVASNPGDLVLPVAPAAPIDGQFIATVRTAAQSWPAIVNECALAAGVTLPALTAAGHIVDWGSLEYSSTPARSPLLIEGTADQAVDLGTPPTARFRVRSDVEPPELARGPVHTVGVSVDATIARDDLKLGLEAIVDSLFGRVPSIIRPQVEEELAPEVDSLLEELLSVVDARGVGRMSITYHTPPEPTPPPGATPGPTAEAGAVWVHIERAGSGAAIRGGRVLELVSCSGPYGPWSGVMRVGGLGPVPFSELTVAFSFEATGGVQSATTSTGGPIPWVLPGITSDVHYDIDAVVDGETMVLTISGTANEQVKGQELFGDISGSAGPRTLPIEPAPEGTCEPQPTQAPAPTPPPTPPPTARPA